MVCKVQAQMAHGNINCLDIIYSSRGGQRAVDAAGLSDAVTQSIVDEEVMTINDRSDMFLSQTDTRQ